MRQLKITKQVTNQDTLSLEKYLREIGKVTLISPEEEVALAKQIRQGDQNALECMVKANLRFVVSVAKQYQNQGLGLSDLINEGNLGLIKAAQRFDETRGFKFISYAVWWIRQSILQAIAEQSRIVKLPLNRIGSINKVNKAMAALEQQFEREPSVDELSELLELAPVDVKEALRSSSRHLSMDAPLTHDDEGNLYDVILPADALMPDNELNSESLHSEIERILHTLSDKEAEVVRLYYGLGGSHQMSLEEIGEKVNLTRERVRQIKEKAIRKMKSTTRSKILKGYLG